MKFMVTGGGTAGHINPAIALARELINRGHDVTFVGTPDGMEADLAVKEGFDYIGLPAAGFNRAHKSTLVTSSLKVLGSISKAKAAIRERGADAVVGFGGYVTLPMGKAAQACKVPLIVHEQNSVPGMANKHLAKHGAEVALTFPMSSAAFECPESRVHVVGNPVRDSVINGNGAAARERLGIPDDATVLLVFGGSLGARHINEAVLALKDRLMAIPDLYVIQSTGKRDHAMLLEAHPDLPERWKLLEYIYDMGDVLAATDLIVSRAGSTSLAEITVCGLPSILVPFPYATDDHQTANARDLEKVGAAVMVADADIDNPEFGETLFALLDDKPRRDRMGEAARSLGRPNATKDLADLVCDCAERGL